MRALLVITAGFIALGGCASLSVVDKAPDRKAVSGILVKALACKAKPGEEPCDPALQPAEIRLAGLSCVSLPLRSGLREAAHARCEWAGEIVRVNGAREALAPGAGDFSLVDLTPGSYRPLREWTLGKIEQ
ncbi:MAG: hypothetical protein AAB227_01735 [Pseudomonadota bacterium]